MKRTPEENMERKAIIEKALRDAVAKAQAHDWSVTPEMFPEFQARIAAAMADLQANEETPALDLLMFASVLQILGEMTGVHPPADRLAWAMDLMGVGGQFGAELLKQGGYPRPTDAQVAPIARFIRKRAEALAALGDSISPANAREEMRTAARTAVEVMLGEAPARAHRN